MSFDKSLLCPCVFAKNDFAENSVNYSQRVSTNPDAEAFSINNASLSRTKKIKRKGPSTRNVTNNRKTGRNSKQEQELVENITLKHNKSDLFHIEETDDEVDWEFLDIIEEQWEALQGKTEDNASENFVTQNIIGYMMKIFAIKKKEPSKKRESEVSDASDPLVKLPDEEQTIGLTRTYKVEFKSVNNRVLERYGKDSDRLMSRLDDLCSKKLWKKMILKNNFKKECKKVSSEHEVCPNCRDNFSVGRKHSCKVCAGVICKTCSKFLDINIARSIRKSKHSQHYEDVIHIQTTSIQHNNVRGAKTDIRLCHRCYGTAEAQIRKCALEDFDKDIKLVGLYEKITNLKADATNAVETYEMMFKRFVEGEKIDPADMQQICRRIRRYADKIYALSKEISALPAHPASRQATLHQSIRRAAIAYIQEILLICANCPLQKTSRFTDI